MLTNPRQGDEIEFPAGPLLHYMLEQSGSVLEPSVPKASGQPSGMN